PGTKTGYSGVYKGLYLDNPPDGHWWVGSGPGINNGIGRVYHAGYIANMTGAQIQPEDFSSEKSYVGGKDWHDVTLIRDEDGFVYSWLDGDYVGWSTDKTVDIPASERFFVAMYDQTKTPLQHPMVLDDVRIYKNKYIPPVNSIAYDSASGSIVIKGWGATLEKIAAAVNDPTVFAYDRATSTATCSKDITIEAGSELRIENGKLLMASNDGRERKIKYHTDTIIKIFNSTLASADGRPLVFVRENRSRFQNVNFKNTFKVVNSTLSNCGGLFLERPVALSLENSKFIDLVGDCPIKVLFRWPLQELKIKGCTFKGKTGSEKIVFQGGDQFGELAPKPAGMDIVDCDFSGVVLEFLADAPYYLSADKPGCTANLINTKAGSVKASDSAVRFKYYLDVKVVGAVRVIGGTATDGKPVVVEATVTVRNEKDDVNYPAENLLTGTKYFLTAKQVAPDGKPHFIGQSNWLKGRADVNDGRTVVTGRSGNTALPADAANTLVLTAKEIRDGAKETFTYTIIAANINHNKLPMQSVAGVAPDETWYRPEPNVPQNTVTIALPPEGAKK
ncbi:MAG: hypothetical protein KKE37_06850, partial [Verrucomicrobia bacterium]|nr:hypothetical protein [Verrucomicrobiota bacterium]